MGSEPHGRNRVLSYTLRAVAWALMLAGALATAQAATPRPAIDCPSCQDYNSCTADSCDPVTGTCRHDPLNCDDGNPCTFDSCDPTYSFGGCRHAPVASDGVCDDGNSCTIGDACDGSGHCVGQAQSAGTVCDDGNSCTSGDACDDGGRCLGASLPPGSSCDDGSLCTSADTCVATPSGSIVCQGAAKDCGDGDLCTVDSCDPSTGQCANTAISCGDGNACTADSCDPATGACAHANAFGVCDDGNFCTTGDSCSNGNCIGGGPTTVCNDGIACTRDTCIPEAPYCRHDPDSSLCGPSPDPECLTVVCDPRGGCQLISQIGKLCHLGSLCQVGRCNRNGCLIEINLCNDFNDCTADTCVDPAVGTCGHSNLDGHACNDGNACTVGDVCANGTCQPGTVTTCDDGDACTIDTCAATGCGHAALSCDDANSCTADACDPVLGCQHVDSAALCDDGNACTTGDSCGNGACQTGTPVNCDDGDPCTLDACGTATGCTHTPQASDVCPENVVGITITRTSTLGKGSGTLFWSTNHEFTVSGFNIIEYDAQGDRIQVNTGLIACKECITGLGSSYSFILPKHKSARGIFVELVHRDGRAELFGPATKQ